MKKIILGIILMITAITSEASAFDMSTLGSFVKYNEEMRFLISKEKSGDLRGNIAIIGRHKVNNVYFVNLDEKDLNEIKKMVDKTIEKIKKKKREK